MQQPEISIHPLIGRLLCKIYSHFEETDKIKTACITRLFLLFLYSLFYFAIYFSLILNLAFFPLPSSADAVIVTVFPFPAFSAFT